jgi:hypothetical protein
MRWRYASPRDPPIQSFTGRGEGGKELRRRPYAKKQSKVLAIAYRMVPSQELANARGSPGALQNLPRLLTRRGESPYVIG